MVSELILFSLTKDIQKQLRLLLKLEGVFLSIYKLFKFKKQTKLLNIFERTLHILKIY